MASIADTVRRVATARERFLECGVVPEAPLHAGIADSWRRSSLFGVGCDDLAPPYFDDLDIGGRLVDAARPVLDRLEESLGDSGMSVLLTDSSGRVLDRRVTDHSLARQLDHIELAPGFGYAEEHVGTNGIGTAIEVRQIAFVAGCEHFTQRLHDMSCAGAPIRDVLTGRMAGLVDITCRDRDAGSLMPVLIGHAAADIERRLLEIGSAGERAMLTEFLTAGRRGGRAILALNEHMTIGNTLAADLLSADDHAIVRDRVADLMRSGHELVDDLVLSCGQPAVVRFRPVASDAGPAGAVVEIDTGQGRRPAPRHLVRPRDLNLAGMSAIFSRVCDDLLAYCRAGTWALVEGEPGTGKLTLAEAVHRRCTPEGSLTVIADGDVAASLSRAESAAAPRTVILRHADRFTSGELTAILAWADTVEGRLWLVATARAGTDLPGVLLHRMPVTLTMPPLRHRIDDVRDLVPVLLGRFAVGRSVSCGPEAMRMLLRARWPGNVTELVQALRHALTRRRIGEIQPSDLPESCQTTGRHALSHWETLERDAIIRTLRETNGDKGAAADLLGISRATIYRRISKYGIATSPQ